MIVTPSAIGSRKEREIRSLGGVPIVEDCVAFQYRNDEGYPCADDKPVFVEDVVRNAAAILREDNRTTSFTVKTVNHESIHDHNAFAIVSSGG